MQMLILIRGIPGSGKSTLAKTIADSMENAIHLETDQFFTRDSHYSFNAELLPEAHKWCEDTTEAHLRAGASVIVSNTFCALWEMDRYIGMAELLGIKHQIIEVHADFGSDHNVPEHTIQNMKYRWEHVVP